jgi:hypothetical protein
VIRRIVFLIAVVMVFSMMGCGLLYTNVVRNHSLNFNNTPVGSKQCSLSAFTVRVPLMPATRQRVQAQWDTNEISDVAKDAGITQIYYTDIKTLEILLGTFRKQTLIIYGD